MCNCSALRHAQGPYKGTIIPGGYSTPKVHYAHAIHGRWRVIVLFFLFVKVSSFQEKNKSDTQRAFALVLADISKLFLGTKKAWS